jgi:hypothetical protein
MPVSWMEAHPRVLEREREAVYRVAPDFEWIDIGSTGGWEGPVPAWLINRPAPRPGLDNLLELKRLKVRILYQEAHPAVAPLVYPLDPLPPREHRLSHDWHLNGDGSLCLLGSATHWRASDTAAELVIKASGWFIEYRLKERGLVQAMSERGLYVSDAHDGLIASVT